MALAACTVLVCALTSVEILLNIRQEHDTAIADARQDAGNVAESLARHASDAFEATDCALFGLAERAASGGPQSSPEALSSWMAMQVTMVPRIHEMFVFDERGRLRASDHSTGPEGVRYAGGMSSFRYHREHPNAGVFISGPVRAEDNRPMILVSRRVDREDGRFAGIVIARLEVAFFERVYDTINVGGHGTITLASDDAVILARKPFGLIGSRMPDATLFEPPFRAQSSGTFLLRSALDRSWNVYAFKRLAAYPLIVEASVSEHEFLSEWRAAAVANAVAIALTVAIIAMLAILLASQIGQRERAEGRLARIALLDALTGLGNRRQFDSTLALEWTRARRSGRPVAMLMIDVDNFKAYNDRFGHPAGDVILTIIGETIGANVRAGELGARYGGEEFAVILPETSTPAAYLVAERIRTALFDRGIPHPGGVALVVTLSIGVAALVVSSSDEQGLLVCEADRALYDAKEGGRNRTSIRSDRITMTSR